jgi:nucleotide-binding universal stress UspA family protein
MFKRILVATDFGEPAASAVDMAVTLASTFNAELLVFHAYWFPPIGYAAFAEGLSSLMSDLIDQDEKTFDGVVAAVRARYSRTDGVLVNAEPWGAILEAAKDRKADLVIVGTHGRRGLSRLFLGSVAERVVRLSPVPVLTAPGREDADAKGRMMSPG